MCVCSFGWLIKFDSYFVFTTNKILFCFNIFIHEFGCQDQSTLGFGERVEDKIASATNNAQKNKKMPSNASHKFGLF